MPYTAQNAPLGGQDSNNITIGAVATVITPGAGDQLDAAGKYFKYICAASDGDVTFVPYKNADGSTLTMAVTAGMILPGRIRRVTAATATLHGWSD